MISSVSPSKPAVLSVLVIEGPSSFPVDATRGATPPNSLHLRAVRSRRARPLSRWGAFSKVRRRHPAGRSCIMRGGTALRFGKGL
ncbi:hypothetical protein D3C78_1485310 [compost metagenome]